MCHDFQHETNVAYQNVAYQSAKVRSRRPISWPDYLTKEIREGYFVQRQKQGSIIGQVNVPGIQSESTTEEQQKTMNAVRILLQENLARRPATGPPLMPHLMSS